MKFKHETSKTYNQGNFKLISNASISYNSNTSEIATGEQLFKTEKTKSVRTLTLPEVNKILGRKDIDSSSTITNGEDPKGLFLLRQLKEAPGIISISDKACKYWIASPFPNNTSNDGGLNIETIENDGVVNSDNSSVLGIRPIVALEGSNLKLESVGTEGTYKFVEP